MPIRVQFPLCLDGCHKDDSFRSSSFRGECPFVLGVIMLAIENLKKQFGQNVAVDDVSLTIGTGEMVGIIGRSGAGKSTLLRCINQLSEPTSGQIAWHGRRVTGLRGRSLRNWQRQCGMIFQQFNLVPRLDVITNVLMGRLSYRNTILSLMKVFSQEERAMAIMTLERVEMAAHALQRADTLSGGQQQRVAIARALVQEPSLLLADEPIASLDPRNARKVMEILRSINMEDGITVLCNLHTLDTARSYCDRIIGMAAGKIVYDGLSHELDLKSVQEIYGAEDQPFDEKITSTMISQENDTAYPLTHVG